ncbi:MAG: GNAT family N-acetyltransferase [Archaeoglobaceae archaeon]
MIRPVQPSEFDDALTIINEAAKAYKGVIPQDRWREPYMPPEELKEEVKAGVNFYGYAKDQKLVGVAGIQPVEDITLIRHTYVLPGYQRMGIGGKLLDYLIGQAETSQVLVGTWENASWAIRFYQKHGFSLVSREEKNRLLRRYWNIPPRQVETSVVLRLTKRD